MPDVTADALFLPPISRSLQQVVHGSLTSSLVDDVFFVLRKSAVRALATSSIQVGSVVD